MLGKIEEHHHTKLKRTIQDVYVHAQNLHVTLYDRMEMKLFDGEAMIITLLMLNFSHFNIYSFFRKITYITIYKNINSPI